MALKTYLLTIEYDDDTDTVEYIEEEIISNEKRKVKIRAYIDLEKVFDKKILDYMRKNYIVGET